MPMIDTRALRSFAEQCQRAAQAGNCAECIPLLDSAGARMLRLAGDIDALKGKATPGADDDGA